MFEEEFEFFIKETYPADYESMRAKYPDQEITELWPQQWDAFRYLKNQFNELIEENTRLDRESKSSIAAAEELSKRSMQSLSMIDRYFKIGVCEPELTLKAVQSSLIGYGQPVFNSNVGLIGKAEFKD